MNLSKKMSGALSESRCGYIDYIRVFAISLVILLHCIADFYSNAGNSGTKAWYAFGFLNELCRVGVPLFFMISGYLLLRHEITDIKSFYKRRILKVLIPFLFYDVFYYFFFCWQNNETPSALAFVQSLFNAGSSYHLWFIYSIVFLYLMMPFIQMILHKIGPHLALFFMFLLVFHATIRPFLNTVFDGSFSIYLAEDICFGYLGYVVLGYLLGTYHIAVKIRLWIYAVALLLMIAIPLWSMYRARNGMDFLFHGGYSLNHYVEAAAVFLLFKHGIKKSSAIVRKLSAVTFGAYFSHVFFIEILGLFQWETSPAIKAASFFAIALLASFGWGFIEKQGINLVSRMFAKKSIREGKSL